ncbi:MAG: hypothetical protein ACOC0Z_01730 [Halohasta sp.]
MNHHRQSSRATIDVINIWCVVVLVVSAISVAGVVGAAVVSGEFEERNFNMDENNGTDADVSIENEGDGRSKVSWSEKGEAKSLEIHVDGERTETLEYVGEETTVASDNFEVIAIYEDEPSEVVETHGDG